MAVDNDYEIWTARAVRTCHPAAGDRELRAETEALSDGAHALYLSKGLAFSERAGFPSWTNGRWVDWVSGDEDFCPERALLATLAGADVGFIVGAQADRRERR